MKTSATNEQSYLFYRIVAVFIIAIGLTVGCSNKPIYYQSDGEIKMNSYRSYLKDNLYLITKDLEPGRGILILLPTNKGEMHTTIGYGESALSTAAAHPEFADQCTSAYMNRAVSFLLPNTSGLPVTIEDCNALYVQAGMLISFQTNIIKILMNQHGILNRIEKIGQLNKSMMASHIKHEVRIRQLNELTSDLIASQKLAGDVSTQHHEMIETLVNEVSLLLQEHKSLMKAIEDNTSATQSYEHSMNQLLDLLYELERTLRYL